MSTIRRTIPKSAEALAALRAGPSAARSGAPGWLAAAAVAGAATLLEPAMAKADPGSVRLRNGGRVSGDVVAVLPNDRVVVLLADGTSMTVPWTDVLFVFDGTRVYDATGNTTELEAAPASRPPAPAPASSSSAPSPASPTLTQLTPSGPAPIYSMSTFRPMDADAMNEYSAMPRRGPTAVLFTFGSLFLSNAILNLTFGSLIRSDGYSSYGGDASRPLLISGSITLGIGAVMVGFGVARAQRRNAIIDRLRGRGYFVAGLHDALGLSFDVDVAPGRFVPRLGLRF